jgi:peptidoglycan/xylan/chitin deacetylase (PgdA/CDA1 family)
MDEKAGRIMRDSSSIAPLWKFYYCVKPFIPVPFRMLLRRSLVRIQLKKHAGVWPIYEPAAACPAQWPGWPGGKRFALVLTHDVDTPEGNEKVPQLMDLDLSYGFRTTFFFVPKSYEQPDRHHELLRRNGFEIGVHGLEHDGKLYSSKKVFNEKAEQINRVIEQWGASGFRSPSMHHNLDWHHRLNVAYDASTYDTDPFEPQGSGIGTIFPFFVTEPATGNAYVELPYTMSQDYTLFVLLKEKNIDTYKRKLDWIVQNCGMAHIITHPDYMSFEGEAETAATYPARYYAELLEYIKTRYEGQYWAATCAEVAAFYRAAMAGKSKT